MSHIPQSLHDAWPEDAALLRRLKLEDAHFQALAAQLEPLEVAIDAMESGEDPAADSRLDQARRERLALLDRIAPILAAHRAAPTPGLAPTS